MSILSLARFEIKLDSHAIDANKFLRASVTPTEVFYEDYRFKKE